MRYVRLQFRKNTGLRQGIGYSCAFLLSCIALAHLLSALAATGAAAAAAPTTPEAAQLTNLAPTIAMTSVLLLLLAGAYLGGLGRYFGATWPGHPRQRTAPLTKLIRYAALALLAIMLSSRVAAIIGPNVESEAAAIGNWWRAQPTHALVINSVAAGIDEELVNLSGPIAAAWIVPSLLVALLRASGRSPGPWILRARFPAAVLVGVIAAVSRVGAHAYQGQVQAWSKLLWAVGMLVVVLVCRSVWPLVVGHAAFDIFSAGWGFSLFHLLPDYASDAAMFVWAIADPLAVVAVFALTFAAAPLERRWRRPRMAITA